MDHLLGDQVPVSPAQGSSHSHQCIFLMRVQPAVKTVFSSQVDVRMSHSVFPIRCCCSVAQSCPALCKPWTAARQASLSFTISWSLLKLMSVESVMPSNHLILSRPLLLLPSVFPSIRVFSNKSAFYIRWPKYWSFPNRRERFVCAVKQSSFWAGSHIMCPIHWYEHDPGLKSLSSGHCLMSVGKALTYLCTEAPTSQEPRWPGVQQHPCWEFQ